MAEAAGSSHLEQFEKKAPTETECLKVVVRCRPFNQKEIHNGNESVVTFDTKSATVELKKPQEPRAEKKCFTFDAVCDRFTKQSTIYEESCRGLVDSVLQGYDGTIFAYGQTGAGKTFTMEGVQYEPSLGGIIPRSFEHIFQHIAQSDGKKYLVRASYYTIYQGEIRDCLSKDKNSKPQIKEHPDTGVYIKDLSMFVVTSVAELEKVFKVGRQNHYCWVSNMSLLSTRVSTFFTITVESVEEYETGEKHIRAGRLNLVDMAGSEKPPKPRSDNPNVRREASKIHMSMRCLENVITALDGERNLVPYRDSKVTRLLKESLGGRAKTVMIAVIGPASCNYDETLHSLRCAERAKNIKNRPKVNINPKDALLQEYMDEIERLKTQLADITVGRDKLADGKNDTQERSNSENENAETNMEESLHDQRLKLEEDKKGVLNDQTLEQSEKDTILSELEDKLDNILKKENEDPSVVTAKIKKMEDKLLTGDTKCHQDKNLQNKDPEEEEP